MVKTMTSADELFLSTVNAWAQEPGTSIYLVGPINGALNLDVQTGAASARRPGMNEALKARF